MAIQPLLVTACDAGTANALVPVLTRLDRPFRLFAQAQAAEIWAAQGLAPVVLDRCGWDELDELGAKVLNHGPFAAVLAGTSWGASIDKAVTAAASRRGLKAAAVVEHWGLYRERFSRIEAGRIEQPLIFLPDQVWVNDTSAKAEAVAAGLPKDRVKVVGQPHLERQRAELAQARPTRGLDDAVVFVSERLAADFPKDSDLSPGFDEFDALSGLIQALPAGFRLVIKLHPQEEPDKYDAFLAERGVRAQVIGRTDVPGLILGAGRLVGMASMLLLEAGLIRDDVISFMPGGRPGDFIGNRLRVTVPILSQEELALALTCPGGSGPAPFGAAFLGSADRFIAAIGELVSCA